MFLFLLIKSKSIKTIFIIIAFYVFTYSITAIEIQTILFTPDTNGVITIEHIQDAILKKFIEEYEFEVISENSNEIINFQSNDNFVEEGHQTAPNLVTFH